jgi:hypothetical protein
MERLQTDFPQIFSQLKNDAVRQDPSLRGNAEKTNRKAVEHVFDKVAKEQFRKITGIEIPADKWGYGQKKGLNYGLGKLREQMCSGQSCLSSQPAQQVLKSTWNRLRTQTARKADDRTWVRGTPKTYRLIGKKVIEGINRSGKSVGYAILKPGDVTQLNRSMRSANLRPTQRRRVPGHLSNYSSNPGTIRASYGRGR